MAAVRSCILGSLRRGNVPSHALSIANEVACEMNGGTVITAVVATLDMRTRVLTFANAGHPPPLMLTADGHVFLHSVPGDIPLGIFKHDRASDRPFDIPRQSLLVFYTDGITEHQRDPVRGEAELIHAARLAFERPQPNDAHAVARYVFGAGRGRDDAAAIGLRIG